MYAASAFNGAVARQVDQREGAAALPPGNRDMTFEEKRRLSHALGALPGDRLGRVLDIVRELQPVDEARAAWGWRLGVSEPACWCFSSAQSAGATFEHHACEKRSRQGRSLMLCETYQHAGQR